MSLLVLKFESPLFYVNGVSFVFITFYEVTWTDVCTGMFLTLRVSLIFPARIYKPPGRSTLPNRDRMNYLYFTVPTAASPDII